MQELVNIRFLKSWGSFGKGEVAGFSEKAAGELCNPFNPQSDRIAIWEDKEREQKAQDYIKVRQAGEVKRDMLQSIRKKYCMGEYGYDHSRLEQMAADDKADKPKGSRVKDYEAMQDEGKNELTKLLRKKPKVKKND